MRLLVLGGTHHVGRAIVEAALDHGDEVTTVNRGTRRPARGVDARVADRRESDALLGVVKHLRDQGFAIIIVTHKLDEVRSIADRATVLRGGRTVLSNGDPSEFTNAELVEAMVGRAVADLERTDNPIEPEQFDLAVVGAHLAGMPLHRDLVDRGARLVARTRTSAEYRLHALANTVPQKPGLERVAADGASIEVEVYRLPVAEVGSFLATVHAPLGIGELVLADGSRVHGFICEPAGLVGARDVTEFGGWRSYLAAVG